MFQGIAYKLYFEKEASMRGINMNLFIERQEAGAKLGYIIKSI